TFDAGPRRIILLLDISGSMGGPGDYYHKEKWDYAKEMVKAFLRGAPAQDLCALDVFAEKEKEIVPLTHDFASVLAAIDALPEPDSKSAKATYGAMTYAGDALGAVLRNAGQGLESGDSVIFFSDGEFEESDTDRGKQSLSSLEAEIAQRRVRVFLVSSLIRRTQADDLPDYSVMQAVANAAAFMAATGGFSFAPGNFPGPFLGLQMYSSNPQKRMATLNNAVQGTYRVELQLDEPLRKKRNLQLELVNDKGKAVKSVFLFYPQSLYPNSPKTH
ncbi:MAG: vWA domain-containing protein, partial [Candidatus Acidiferrales bacterium]